MFGSRAGAVALVAVIIGVALTGSVDFGRSAAPGSPTAVTPERRGSAAPTPGETATPTPAPSPTQAGPPAQPASLQLAGGYGPGGLLRTTGTASVALTFDDGPDGVNTPRLLDLLKRNGVKATFCVVGERARLYPAMIRRISAEGHTLCNHSWRHRWDLATLANGAILKDLRDTNNAIHAAAPRAAIKYFRAPGGQFTTRLVGLAASLGMRSLHWSVNSGDWDYSTYGHGTSMINHVTWWVRSHTVPGAIVLSHDYHKPDTVAAYTTLLPWLKARFTLGALPT